MKQKNKQKNLKQGFTLLELLVIVLIIGILASIALPQYQMAVTKAKVASILPIMRRFKDALQEYKLQHGNYEALSADELGVSWPSDWKEFETNNPCSSNSLGCSNDYWKCFATATDNGEVTCLHLIGDGEELRIYMYPPDFPDYEILGDKILCCALGEEANKICKALGAKSEIEDHPFSCDYLYSL